MVPRLITYGCSFTYGDELQNRESSWPYVLGKHIGLPCINLGVPNYSNDAILQDVPKTELENALVVVCWTTYLRMQNIPKAFVASLDDQWLYGRWLNQVILLQSYLKTKNVPYVFFNAFDNQQQFDKYSNIFDPYIWQIDTDNFLGWPYNGFVEWAYGTPQGPKGHPLDEGHAKVAEILAEHIRSNNVY